MSKRVQLPPSQLFDSRYTTAQIRHYGKYHKSLEDLYNHTEKLEKQRKEDRQVDEEQEKTSCGALAYIWKNTFRHFGDEWTFLAVLGILVAIISYITDKGVMMCGKAQMWLYNDLADHHFAKYVAWICLPICLILFDVGFTHLVAPQAAGSGLPQIKTILRGVILKECLTFKVLIAKWVGITSTLGSGMPLGKEGPLIHISTIIMRKMSKFIHNLNGIKLHEGRSLELLGAAWAVGVACTFNAPIGGVLFSVEITTAYFAVRNYWRGFFAAVWAATIYRLLSVWIDGVDTITVVFKTSFFVDFPYAPQELFAFAITGLICGLGGSFYIWCKQRYNKWLNNNSCINSMNKCNRFIYPGFVALLVSTATFPLGIGQFIASDLTPRDQVISLFGNFTWTEKNLTINQREVLTHWTTRYSGIYVNLVSYAAFQFVFSIMSSSLAIPNGSFIPNFRTGAVVGRIIGELMHTWFPLGVRYKGKITQIMPGAYATVGAAAFGGAVTHTMSVCVILFEMTSQITHVIPVLIAVLIANGVASLLTPSIYDLVIKAKKLPYLPDLLPSSSAIYNVCVEDFMVHDVSYIFLGMSFGQLKQALQKNRKLRTFPLVNHPQNMVLLGSISRRALIKLLERQVGRLKRWETLLSPDEIIPEPERKVKTPMLRICDLPETDQVKWQQKQLEDEVDFTKCVVDPAPFQLVKETSLLKVHSLFSLMAVNLAYVTSIGKLVGVVGLTELRLAIEAANSGNLPKKLEKL